MVYFDLELIRWYIQHPEMDKLDQNYVFYYTFLSSIILFSRPSEV